jgi:hypothetical protein
MARSEFLHLADLLLFSEWNFNEVERLGKSSLQLNILRHWIHNGGESGLSPNSDFN